MVFFFQLLLDFLILKANPGKIFNLKLENQNLNKKPFKIQSFKQKTF